MKNKLESTSCRTFLIWQTQASLSPCLIWTHNWWAFSLNVTKMFTVQPVVTESGSAGTCHKWIPICCLHWHLVTYVWVSSLIFPLKCTEGSVCPSKRWQDRKRKETVSKYVPHATASTVTCHSFGSSHLSHSGTRGPFHFSVSQFCQGFGFSFVLQGQILLVT